MRRKLHRLGAALLALVASAAALPALAQSEATVRVHANTFDPFEVSVDPDGTVSWLVEEGGHTIEADDGRFSFRGDDGGTLGAGATVSYAVGTTEEYIPYYCTIHGGPGGQGMSGVIEVGDPPPPPPAEDPVIDVPADEPTIAEAVEIATPGYRIEVAPGTHTVTEPVEIDLDDLTIAGTGADPSEVVVEAAPGGRGFPGSALRVTGSHVRVENLTVRGFRSSGIHLDGANAAAVVDVAVDGGSFTLDGIVASGVTGATITGTTTTGARRAGVVVTDCTACGALVDHVRSEGNLVGVLVEAARGVIVRDSDVLGNAAGVVAHTGRQDAQARPVVVDVRDNRIADNTSRTPLAGARDEDRMLAVGAGVWLAGPADAAVDGNEVTGHNYGIVVAGDAARETAVTDNHLDGNADADLAWDGLGANICFEGNASDDGTPTSDPPSIEELYPCDRPTAGIPYPVVGARLLTRALS